MKKIMKQIVPPFLWSIGRKFKNNTGKYYSINGLLNDLLSIAKAPKNIDLLSLDVEGAEIEVLKGIDHKAYRFQYMCIECRDIYKLTSYLNPLGYELKEKLSGHDYLFVDKKL